MGADLKGKSAMQAAKKYAAWTKSKDEKLESIAKQIEDRVRRTNNPR